MRSSRAIAVLFVCFLAFPTWASGQVGEIAFANSGATEAQEPFLHGVAQLHNFQYREAAEAFREARRIDPDFVMAFWGEAMTHNHPIWLEQDSTAARGLLLQLGANREARLAKAPTARERAYLQAVETLYGRGQKETRDFAYADAMRDVHERYPTDPDAAAFYALSILGTAHKGRDAAIYIRAASVVEDVFDAHPNHPGAAHYLIHSYDDPVHAPLGLRAAQAYSRIAPDAAHAQHMTSHIFVAMGMWDDVVAANENARRVAIAGAEARGAQAAGCGHYNYWLEYGYLQQDRAADAHSLLRECYQTATKAMAGQGSTQLDPDASARGSYAAMLARYVLDTEDWENEALGWTIPLDDLLPARLTWTYINGYAAAQRGELVTTEVSREALEGARRELNDYLGGNPAGADANRAEAFRTRARVLEMQLLGLLQAGRGQEGAARSTLSEAARLEDALPVMFGPPFVEKPSRELLGEVLLAAGDREGAADAFQSALERTPGRLASARGLEKALAPAAADATVMTEESRVLATVQAFFDALAAKDTAAAARTLTESASLIGTRETPDGTALNESTRAEFLQGLSGGSVQFLERMWDPTVMIRGAIAVVWTPYDFHRDGEFSHCGIDAANLVRTSEGWRIAGIVYTAEATGCAPSPLGSPGA